MQAGTELNHGLGVQGLSNRMGGAVADTTALAAIPARRRRDQMPMVVWNSGDPELYFFDADAGSGDVAPSAGSGYWVRYSPDVVEDESVTGDKLVNTAIGAWKPTAVVLDHADVSPKTLLAADATFDRHVLVWLVATEAAAGGTDIDVGSASTDATAIVEDVGAGAWADGDRFFGACLLPAGEALVATIADAGTAGKFDVFVLALPLPKVVETLVAGQNETVDATVTVTGIKTTDEIIKLWVLDPGTDLIDRTADASITGADEITLANPVDNSGAAVKYMIAYTSKS